MIEQTRDLSIAEALDYGCHQASIGRHDDAIGLFKGVLIHEPSNFEAMIRLGASLFETKRTHEALYWFWRTRKLNRKHPMALTNYGICLGQLGHWDEAIPELERAVYQADRMPQVSPEAKALCYNNLGNTLEKLKRYPQALKALDHAIAINPNDSFPHYNRGIVLLRLNRQSEAIEALDRCLALKPNDADALYNRGMGRLLQGDFEGGFADYEARLLTSENEVINLGLPGAKQWQGEDLTDRIILIHCEQGLGDDIQFLRYLPELAKLKPKRMLLITHTAIKPLLDSLLCTVELNCPITVLAPGVNLDGAYHVWTALMSLPHRLHTTAQTIPPPWCPVIEPDRIDKWCEQLGLLPGFTIDATETPHRYLPKRSNLSVGVCWAGNWRHKNDEHRSIPLATFGNLFDVPGIDFISLQQIRPGEMASFEALKEKHDNLRAFYFDDFRDTAAAMLNLDMVISVDTAVAHLSASLGVETRILIPAFGTDWRWQLTRTDCPWYPSATLDRQPKVGDWASVIAALKRMLNERANKRRAA